jgi:hypothetical protein
MWIGPVIWMIASTLVVSPSSSLAIISTRVPTINIQFLDQCSCQWYNALANATPLIHVLLRQLDIRHILISKSYFVMVGRAMGYTVMVVDYFVMGVLPSLICYGRKSNHPVKGAAPPLISLLDSFLHLLPYLMCVISIYKHEVPWPMKP